MSSEPTSADRRPIKGWEEFYEVTRDGQVYSVRTGHFLKYAEDDQGRKYIEVQIGGVRYERNIRRTVEEAWGDTSQLAPAQINPAPVMDPASVKLFDHVVGTYQPPIRWGKKRLYAADVGKRGLFQCVGVITKQDKQGCLGDPAMMPRDLPGWPRFDFIRCPLSHLVELERASKEVTEYRMGEGAIKGLGRKP